MRKLTTEQFIEKARAVHGDRYDYSKVEYVDAKTKVPIVCMEHGVFMQSPDKHGQGRGCHLCSGGGKLTKEQWIEKARAVHGNRYDYSKVEYKHSQEKVAINCLEHGVFMQSPAKHTGNGRGCPKCGYVRLGSLLRKGNDEFIAQGTLTWGDRYDYSLVDYRDANSHVTLTCKEHGYTFEQIARSHVGGKQGCPYCSSNNRGAGMVYLIEIHVPDTEEKFLKIGWTTSNVRTRFREDAFEWKQLNRKMFPNAYLGERWERYMQNMFDDCRYKPKHSFGGETECFGYQYKELIQKTFAEEAKRGN